MSSEANPELYKSESQISLENYVSNEIANSPLAKQETNTTKKSTGNELSIKIQEETQQLTPKSEDPFHEPIRWDLIIYLYLFGLLITTASFSMSQDAQLNKFIFITIYTHLVSEIIFTFHLLFSPKSAKILSIIAIIIYSGEAFILNPITPIKDFQNIFNIQFVIGDMAVCTTAFYVMINGKVLPEMRKIGYALFLHFAGVSLSLGGLPSVFFVDPINTQFGQAWVLLGLAVIPQGWIMKEGLLSKWNQNKYRSDIYLSIWQKITPWLFGVMATIGIYIASQYRTEERVYGIKFAATHWQEFIDIAGWPIGLFGIIVVTYYWREARIRKFKGKYTE